MRRFFFVRRICIRRSTAVPSAWRSVNRAREVKAMGYLPLSTGHEVLVCAEVPGICRLSFAKTHSARISTPDR